MQRDAKNKLIKRLSSYWKLEAANMVLIPAMMVYFTKSQISLWTMVATMAAVMLLGVGAL